MEAIIADPGAHAESIGVGDGRVEATLVVTDATLPGGSALMCAVGFGASGVVTDGVGLYADGTFRSIGGGMGELKVVDGEDQSQHGNVLMVGTYIIQAVRISGVVHVSFKYTTSDSALNAIGCSFTGAGGSFANVTTPALSAGVSVSEFSCRDDLSCYTTSTKMMRLTPLLTGGTDYAYVWIPADHSLTGLAQTIYACSHPSWSGTARKYDYFREDNTFEGVADMTTAGYVYVYVDGRPSQHWGNTATAQHIEATRAWLAQHFNVRSRVALYGTSMAGALAATYARLYPAKALAVALDVPAIDVRYMYDNALPADRTEIETAWGGVASMDAGNPGAASHYGDYVDTPIWIEAGDTDTTCPVAMITPWANGITAAGALCDYDIIVKGHAGTITPAKRIAYYPTVMTADLSLSPDDHWSQSGTSLSVTAPRGRRTSVQATAYSTLGGTLKFLGAHAGRFTCSLDDVTYVATRTLGVGTTTVYLGVTPEAGDTILTAQVAVPL